MESEALARKLVRRAKEAMVLVENLQFDIENNDNGTKLEMLESVCFFSGFLLIFNVKFSFSVIIFKRKLR